MATVITAENGGQCHACGRRVYEMEKLIADNHAYHKKCFKCCKCSSVLRVGNYASMDAKIFCKPHFVECFKQNGNYQEGFGRERLKSRESKHDESKHDESKHDEQLEAIDAELIESKCEEQLEAGKENVPVLTEQPAIIDDVSHSSSAGSVRESQSISSLNPTEFTLALEEKKRKLLQAARASSEKVKERTTKPMPGRLRPPPEIAAQQDRQHLARASSRPDEAEHVKLRPKPVAAGSEQQRAAECEQAEGQRASAASGISASGGMPSCSQERLLDPQPVRREPRPVSWSGGNTTHDDNDDEGGKRVKHAAAAAASITPGSIKLKMMDLEASKEASKAATAAQRRLRAEADAKAAQESAIAAASAAAVVADAREDSVAGKDGVGGTALHFAEISAVKSRFESGDASTLEPRPQTAAREEVEQVRSTVGHRAAALRSRFQKKIASRGGLSPAKSMPDLVPPGDASPDEGDATGHSLDEDEPNVPASLLKDKETAPKPGQLKCILSKLQSIQDTADKKEKGRPRPVLIPKVDRYHSGLESGGCDAPAEVGAEALPDAKFQEEPWAKKAKSLRLKFECKEELPTDAQQPQSPRRPKPINILAEIEAYEQHNKAMGMKVTYVVESKASQRPSGDTVTDSAALSN